MDFAVTFKPGVPKDIVDAIDGLLSGIDGIDSTQLSLHSYASSALLVKLSQHVVQRTHAYYIQQHARTDGSSAAGAPRADVTSAEAVLLGISFLEAIQVDSNILQLLQQHGYLHHKATEAAAAAAAAGGPAANAAPTTAAAAAKSSSLAGSSSSAGSSAVSPLSSITASPASGLPIYPATEMVPAAAGSSADPAAAGGGAAEGRKDQAIVESVRALLGSSNKEQQQQQQQQDVEESEFLIPLLLRCGVTSDVQPLHDHLVIQQLKRSTWRSTLAPADDFRWYFGNHVGFYLSFLNAMTVWLLAPAAVSLYLSLAVRSSSSSTGITASTTAADAVSNPLVPILLVFHLLWSAAGLKLWRRQEAGLNHKWYHTPHRSSSSATTGSCSSSSSKDRRSDQTPMHGQSHPLEFPLQPVSGHAINPLRSAAAAAPAGPKDAASATAAATANVIGRLPGADVALPLAGAAGTDTVFSDRWSGGVPVASLVTPAAAGVRREYTGTWTTNPITHQAELLNPIHNQLLRYLASMTATLLLLLAAAAVLLVCLNVQGYIPPLHVLVYVRGLSQLSLPGGVFAADQGIIMSQVPLMLRVLATTIFATSIYRPAAMLLTAFENHRTVEGYAASLTVKQASLNALFTFVPVTYVGLLGAGAVAARAEIMGFFRVELLRRIAMELFMPWILYWISVKRARRVRSNMVKGRSDVVKAESNMVKDAAAAVSALVEEITPESPTENQRDENSNARKLSSAAAARGGDVGTQRDDAVSDCCKPSYDIFTDCWELNRDLGYMLLFAAVYPPAAVICLLFNIVKIKQDCLKLLVVYKRPVPAQLRGIGSWKTVLTVQVFLAVITNIFLSGLSTGQLAQLLPSALVPDSVKSTLVAAVAARPALSTAASNIPIEFSGLSSDLNLQQRGLAAVNLNPSLKPVDGAALSGGPVLNIFQDINSGGTFGSGAEPAATGGLTMINHYAKAGILLNDSLWEAAKMCVNNITSGTALFGSHNYQGFSYPGGWGSDQTLAGVYHSMNSYNPAAMAAAAAGRSVSSSPAADHLLLLFVLEHLLVIAMLLIVWIIPSEPAVVRDAARQQQLLLTQLLQQQQQQQKESSMVAGKTADVQATVQPTRLHKNPLYADATARPSAAVTM